MKKLTGFLILMVMFAVMLAGCAESKDIMKPFNGSESKKEEIVYDYKEYITLGEYKGIEVEKLKTTEVTRELVELNIKNALYGYADKEEVELPAENGNIVVVDYSGTIDGEPIQGGSASDAEIVLGLGNFIEDLENGILGMKTGEEKVIEARFPDDYDEESLRGKLSEFKVKVTAVYKAELPEYNDEFVKETYGYETVAEFEEYVEDYLKQAFAQDNDTAQRALIWQKIRENCEVKGYPDGEIESYMNDYIDYYESMAEYYNMSFDEFMQQNYYMSGDDFKAQLEEQAKTSITDTFIIQAIADAENMQVSDDEFKDTKDELLASYGYEDEAAFKTAYGESFESFYGVNSIKLVVLQQKVEKFVFENAILK